MASTEEVIAVIKRNASYERGMCGLSIHDQPGGSANIQSIGSETELREKLLSLGYPADHSAGLLESLKTKHDSVKISIRPNAAG